MLIVRIGNRFINIDQMTHAEIIKRTNYGKVELPQTEVLKVYFATRDGDGAQAHEEFEGEDMETMVAHLNHLFSYSVEISELAEDV